MLEIKSFISAISVYESDVDWMWICGLVRGCWARINRNMNPHLTRSDLSKAVFKRISTTLWNETGPSQSSGTTLWLGRLWLRIYSCLPLFFLEISTKILPKDFWFFFSWVYQLIIAHSNTGKHQNLSETILKYISYASFISHYFHINWMWTELALTIESCVFFVLFQNQN